MFEGKLALRILLTSFDTNLPLLTDPSLHHHVARAAGAHAARPRGEELAGARAQAARGPLQADARRGEWGRMSAFGACNVHGLTEGSCKRLKFKGKYYVFLGPELQK